MAIDEIAALGDEILVLFGDTAGCAEMVNGQRLGDIADFGPAVCHSPCEVGILCPFLSGDEHPCLYDSSAFNDDRDC